jgi:hypothetical protein
MLQIHEFARRKWTTWQGMAVQTSSPHGVARRRAWEAQVPHQTEVEDEVQISVPPALWLGSVTAKAWRVLLDCSSLASFQFCRYQSVSLQNTLLSSLHTQPTIAECSLERRCRAPISATASNHPHSFANPCSNRAIYGYRQPLR